MTEDTQELPENEAKDFAGIRMGDVVNVLTDNEEHIFDGWFEEAEACRSPKTLTELSERLLGGFSHTEATLPLAAFAIVLAALKMISSSEQGFMTLKQRKEVMWRLVYHTLGIENEPIKIVRYADLLLPSSAEAAVSIEPYIWDWLQGCANMTLKDLEQADKMEPAIKTHLQSIVDGKVPFNLPVLG
jgi:hypothetical protein